MTEAEALQIATETNLTSKQKLKVYKVTFKDVSTYFPATGPNIAELEAFRYFGGTVENVAAKPKTVKKEKYDWDASPQE